MEKKLNVLQNLYERIQQIIEQGKAVYDEVHFEKFIRNVCFYLNKYKINLSVDLKIKFLPCDQCGKFIKEVNKYQSFILNCGHTCCKNTCLQTLVRLSNKIFTDYGETKCKVCNLNIQQSLIFDAFGGEVAFRELLNDYEEQRAAKFTCGICYSDFRMDRGITLDCDHRYCRDCMSNYLTLAIDEARVTENDIACPECMNPIETAIVINLLDKKTYLKFEKFRLRGYTPNEKGNLVFYKCQGKDCEYFELLDERIESFECPLCAEIKCPNCRDEPHKGINCEANFKRKKEAKDKQLDDDFIKAAKELGFRTCPHCKSMCERISGCKFMRCFSPLCKGKKSFCLLCEMAMNEDQHFSHYKSKGPYGEICNTMDGTHE